MRLIVLIYLGLLISSCNSNHIKIDYRDGKCDKDLVASKTAYIVNTSRTLKLKATLKTVINVGDTSKEYKTSFYELLPGEEEKIGCTEILSPQLYEAKEEMYYEKEMVQETNDEIKEILSRAKIIHSYKQYDTVINGQSKQYYFRLVNDSTKPLKRIHTKFRFEITAEYEENTNHRD